jgi:formiminotetrahydrofolate cyclodeaminase
MLVDKTVKQLLDAFEAPTPTPGGGSAAALSGAVAAALLAMVAGMPKTKTGTLEERAALDAALPEIRQLRAQLTSLIDRDSASYDAVVGAYRLPKATDDEKAARRQAVRDALRLATDVPLETARAAAHLVAFGRAIQACGNPNARTDVAVAIHMARTAVVGGIQNVEINLDGVGDDAYAARVRSELDSLRIAISDFEL